MMKDVRKLFPFNALNAFLNKTSQLFVERLQQHSAATTALPPNVLTKIKDAVKTGSGLAVQRVTESIFRVARINCGEKHRIVDVARKTCTCGWYQEVGIPCFHACAVMFRHQIPADQLCHNVAKKETLVRVYSEPVIPVDVEDVEEVTLLPPPVPKKIGRPKGKRIKSALEVVPKKKRFCSLCGGTGHNKRTCAVN